VKLSNEVNYYSRELGRALEEAGLRLDNLSAAWRNEWIVKNRLEGKVQLMRPCNNDVPLPIPFPVSHMLLMARK
jgi:hypothetical protein